MTVIMSTSTLNPKSPGACSPTKGTTAAGKAPASHPTGLVDLVFSSLKMTGVYTTGIQRLLTLNYRDRPRNFHPATSRVSGFVYQGARCTFLMEVLLRLSRRRMRKRPVARGSGAGENAGAVLAPRCRLCSTSAGGINHQVL